MRFFFDNCLSPQLPQILRDLGERDRHELVHLQEKFLPNTPDPEWIGTLGKERDWIIVSSDERISTSLANKAAWHEARLTAFFFAPPFQDSHRMKQAEEILRWWPEIVRQSKKTPAGHGFRLPMGGRDPKQIYPPAQRSAR